MNDISHPNSYRRNLDFGKCNSVFHKKTERINWKKLAAVDIERVVQNNDVGALRDNIKHVAFCDLEAEMEIHGGDRTLAKLFKMAQLMIDYLLSSQEHLASLAGEAEERCAVLLEETENAKRKVQESELYISEIKRECHRRKKLILAQQQIMDSGPETYHRCPYCVKAFLNASFLQVHLEKRHSERYIRSMYFIDNKREKSPHREKKQDFHSSSERRIEELIRQFADQRNSSGDKADELEHLRRMMENMMKQQRDEMDEVVKELEKRLQEVNRRSMKTRSHLGNLIDDKDDLWSQKAGEEAIQKAISDRKRQKKALKTVEDNLAVAGFEPISLDKALGSSRLTTQLVTLSSSGSYSTEPIINTRCMVGCSNNNDYGILNNSSIIFTTELGTSSETIDSFSNYDNNSKKKINILEKPVVQNRQKPVSLTHSAQVYTNPKSPVRHLSPEMIRTSVSLRDSMESQSRASESVTFDQIWEMNDEYRIQAREEVLNMLAEHLEHHGIKRNVAGISNSVLRDKTEVIAKEKQQLSIKYINFAALRQKLVKEVEEEARKMLQEQQGPRRQENLHQQLKYPPKPFGNILGGMSSLQSRQSSIEKREKGVVISSESDWDEKSTRKDNKKLEKEAVKRNNPEHEERKDVLRSPSRKQNVPNNNARVSSELSNSINSSLWGPSESKAVTSVVPPGNTHKSILTNKSSDLGNQTDSFDET